MRNFNVMLKDVDEKLIDETKKEYGIERDSDLLRKLLAAAPSETMLIKIMNDKGLPPVICYWAARALFTLTGKKGEYIEIT